MAHTPGPWVLAEANTTIPIRSFATGKTVATVRYGSTDLDDARLIKAAPSMLKALTELLEWCDSNVPYFRDTVMDGMDVANAADAAIAEAAP